MFGPLLLAAPPSDFADFWSPGPPGFGGRGVADVCYQSVCDTCLDYRCPILPIPGFGKFYTGPLSSLGSTLRKPRHLTPDLRSGPGFANPPTKVGGPCANPVFTAFLLINFGRTAAGTANFPSPSARGERVITHLWIEQFILRML